MNQFKLFILSFLLVLGACQSGSKKYAYPEKGKIVKIPNIENIVIDGKLNDWKNKGTVVKLFANEFGETLSPDDLSAKFSVGWTIAGLVIAIEVEDDIHYENKGALWTNDGVEIFLTDKRGGENIIQFIIAPGHTDSFPEIRVNKIRNKSSKKLLDKKVEGNFVSSATAKTYIIEGLIPLSNLDIVPANDREIGMQIYINDIDTPEINKKDQLIWHYINHSYQNALAFHRLVLSKKENTIVNSDVKSFIVDNEYIQFVVYGESEMAGKEVRFYENKEQIHSAKLEPETDNAVFIYNMKLTKPDTAYKPVGVFIDKKLAGVIDFSIVPRKYIKTEAPNRFEPDIRIFEKQDSDSFPPTGATLVIGSSSIRKWKWIHEDLNENQIIHRGFGGSTMADVLHFINRIVIPYQPAKIVIYEGDNDLAGETTPDEFIAQSKKFISIVQDSLPDTEIYFLAVKHSPARAHLLPKVKKANHSLDSLARETPDVEFIDINKVMYKNGKLRHDIWENDNLHMNRKGYLLWRDVIQARIKD